MRASPPYNVGRAACVVQNRRAHVFGLPWACVVDPTAANIGRAAVRDVPGCVSASVTESSDATSFGAYLALAFGTASAADAFLNTFERAGGGAVRIAQLVTANGGGDPAELASSLTAVRARCCPGNSGDEKVGCRPLHSGLWRCVT